MKRIISFGLFLCFIGLWTACKNSSEKKEEKNAEIEKPAEEKQAGKLDTEIKYAEGKAVYQQYCVTCHQSTGSGVPNLNPPLKQTEFVLGDKETLVGIVLNGSSEGLEINGQVYSNNMPPFNYLKDEEIADVLSYIRNNFGNEADPVTVSEVEKIRGKQ